MDIKVPSTLIASSTMVGRIYGQGSKDECLFDVSQDLAGRPIIAVRMRPPGFEELRMPHGATLLVQLFEQPDVLWHAHATLLNDETPMIIYAPIEPLESADGRVELPALAEVTADQKAEGEADARSANDHVLRDFDIKDFRKPKPQ